MLDDGDAELSRSRAMGWDKPQPLQVSQRRVF